MEKNKETVKKGVTRVSEKNEVMDGRIERWMK